jgi:hypothetical protein
LNLFADKSSQTETSYSDDGKLTGWIILSYLALDINFRKNFNVCIREIHEHIIIIEKVYN